MMRRDRESINPPDELTRNDSEKIPVGRIVRSKFQNLARVCNYLPDSNLKFRPARINSALISRRTVTHNMRSTRTQRSVVATIQIQTKNRMSKSTARNGNDEALTKNREARTREQARRDKGSTQKRDAL